ncbi:MAG TPA: hypothetical protein PKD73_15025 [Burkholderiaceae bacterium]|jgi:quercetin dioxygenase-like cupin family protein|nr:hypothetical protein [Burkholderiaceae bacterium]
MALHHLTSGERASVRPLGAALAQSRSEALFKTDRLEVIRLVLPTGKGMPAHQVVGDITIQCVEGVLEVTLPSGTVTLTGGELVYLAGSVPHGVKALHDASALVTIVLEPS